MTTDTAVLQARIRSYAKRAYIIRELGGCCSSCGKVYHVYDLHHKDPSTKESRVSTSDRRLSQLMHEASKCELLCKNCHREKHTSTGGTRGALYKKLMLEYLGSSGCAKCGYSTTLAALDLHHLDPSAKDFEPSDIVAGGKGLISGGLLTRKAKDELDKCTVLCANCHALEHFDMDFYSTHFDAIIAKSHTLREIQPRIDPNVVLDMLRSGVCRAEIARQLGASKGTITDILKGFGEYVPQSARSQRSKEMLAAKRARGPKPRLRKFNPSLNELRELRKSYTYRQLGVMFGVSYVAVYRRCVSLGIE